MNLAKCFDYFGNSTSKVMKIIVLLPSKVYFHPEGKENKKICNGIFALCRSEVKLKTSRILASAFSENPFLPLLKESFIKL